MVKGSRLISLLCFIAGCSTGAIYPYYAFDSVHGVLLGPTPDKDLPVSVCDGIAGTSYPCIIQKQEVYFEKDRDLIDCRERLKACEAR